MEQFKYIQPLDQMERISRTELGEKLDEILDKVDKNNVGFVITDNGKDDLVLCPIRWIKCTYDDDFGCIINSALRYAIGRHTYMPSVVMDFVRKYIGVLDTKTISVMIEDIEREAEYETLDKRIGWLALRDDLKAHYETMLRKSIGGNETENG
jgi:hypothetical protein